MFICKKSSICLVYFRPKKLCVYTSLTWIIELRKKNGTALLTMIPYCVKCEYLTQVSNKIVFFYRLSSIWDLYLLLYFYAECWGLLHFICQHKYCMLSRVHTRLSNWHPEHNFPFSVFIPTYTEHFCNWTRMRLTDNENLNS